MVLLPTAGNQQDRILAAIDSLQSGGSTLWPSASAPPTSSPGRVSSPCHQPGHPCLDGDRIVRGLLDELQQLIEQERRHGVYLSVLGFGRGNYRDDTMELLADKGTATTPTSTAWRWRRTGCWSGDERHPVHPASDATSSRVQPGLGGGLPADRLREPDPATSGSAMTPRMRGGGRRWPPGERPVRADPAATPPCPGWILLRYRRARRGRWRIRCCR